MNPTIIQIIQTMLVPGIMVSACGLLLLGMNNKYSIIVNRIRLLKQEERNLCTAPDSPEGDARSVNVALQLPLLLIRLKLVRNAVFSYSIAIAFFIFASLMIGVHYVSDSRFVHFFIIAAFLAGMGCVLLGIIYAAVEVRRGYDIIRIEAGNIEQKI